MTDSTPAGRVTTALAQAGYRRLENGLRVGNLKFDFLAAFVPLKSSSELVLLADTTEEPEALLVRKVEGVARALDVSQSMRSLTLIVTGARPSDQTLETLSRVCRVLPTGSISGTDGEAVLRNWIAVLLPLSLRETEASPADPLSALHASAEALDENVKGLIDVALHGQDAVRVALHLAIDKATHVDGGEST